MNEEPEILEQDEQELYEHHRIEIPKGQAMLRVDKYLMNHLENSTRSKIQTAIEAGCVVVKGNLALNGAVMKPSAATPALMKHRGRAVVFECIEDYHARVDDPDLDIDETCVMVLKYVGPVGYPGMPEVGNMDLPKKNSWRQT